MPSISQDDPPNDEEEREGHSDAQTNVNAKEDSRSKGHQPNHLHMCACTLHADVCMYIACGCVHDKKQIGIPTKCHLNSFCSYSISFYSQMNYVRTLLIIE